MPIDTNPLTGAVAALLNDRELVINIGDEAGVREGMRFSVLEPKNVIRDPVTNAELGHLQRVKVRVKVIEVQPKFAVARTYETYQTQPDIQDIWGTMARVRESLVARARAETKVRTLRMDDKPMGFSDIDESSSYVSVGDPVQQLADEVRVQSKPPMQQIAG
jgi:hypothetical protein